MSGVYRSANATVAAHSAAAVTPSDVTRIPATRGLFVGTAGNVSVRMADDENVVTFVNIANGTMLPLQVIQVMATNTTATNIIALN